MGELVFDLFVDVCPKACENFIKLCMMKYYHQCLIYNIQSNYILQSGDPTGTGKGGNSIYGIMKKKVEVFDDELNPNITLKNKIGYLGMSHLGDQENTNQSQFFITLRTDDMEHLKKQYTIFGELAEGEDVLIAMNELYCDDGGRPYQDVRILHTYILDDPYPTPEGLVAPDASPVREIPSEERVKPRIPWEPPRDPDNPSATTTTDGRTEDEILASIRQKEAKSRAIVLEMTGDLPDADVKPPDEVLFVCKLNPITRDEDLEIIFSRFGKIKSCEIIRDHKTGDSLNYAFIEYENEGSCIEAYEKMNNVLIDDRRIKVDFSQSVSKLWNRFLMRPRQKPLVPLVKKEEKGGEKRNEGNNYPQRRRDDDGRIESKGYQKEDRKGDYKREDKERERRRSRSREGKERERRERRDDSRPRRDRDDSRSRKPDRREQERDRGSDRRDRDREDRVDRSRGKDERRDRGSDKKEREKERDRDRRRSNSNDRDRKRSKRSHSR